MKGSQESSTEQSPHLAAHNSKPRMQAELVADDNHDHALQDLATTNAVEGEIAKRRLRGTEFVSRT